MSNKVWWKSKTLWVNAIAASLVAAEAVTGAMQPYVSVNFYAAMAVFLPITNAFLRVVTTEALSVRKDV
jgi:hypothetical protein